MAELRLWAYRRFARRQMDDAGTADPEQPIPLRRPFEPDRPGSDRLAIAEPLVSLIASAPPDRPPSPAPVSLVVVGVGGPAGVTVIEYVCSEGYRVIATDTDAFADGLRLVDESLVTPPIEHPSFLGVLHQLIDRVEADAVVCADADSLHTLSTIGRGLDDSGAATWFPDAYAAALTRDRIALARVLDGAGVPSDLGVRADDSPDRQSANGAPVGERPMYAVDALVDRSGVLVGAVAYWRPAGRSGGLTIGSTFHNPAVPVLVSATLAAVGLQGPAMVTGRIEEDGAMVVTGVAPGFSVGLPLTVAAGADLVGQYVNGLLDRPIRSDLLTYHTGVSLPRSDGTRPRGQAIPVEGTAGHETGRWHDRYAAGGGWDARPAGTTPRDRARPEGPW